MTRRGERTRNQAQNEKQGRRRPEERGANNYRSSHVFKALLLSPLPVSKKKRESGKREDEKRKTDVQAALVQITQQTAAIHITQTLTRSH